MNGEGRVENLQSVSVVHEGKKELEVWDIGTWYTLDYGNMVKQMTDLIEKNVIDLTLHKWIIPNFTTTTSTKIVAASVIMMATLQMYFDYKFGTSCGLPQVTLLGEKLNWVQIVGQIEKLK